MRWVLRVIRELNRAIENALQVCHPERACDAPSPARGDDDREMGVCRNTLRASIDAMEQLAAQVEQQVTHYEQLVEFVSSGYVETDVEGVIQRANGSAVRMLRRPRNVLQGTPLVALIADRDIPEFLHRVSALRAGEEPAARCVTLRPQDGEPLRASICAGALRATAGEVVGFRCLFREVDAR